MKKFINSKYMKWFRWLFISYLYYKLYFHVKKYNDHMFLCRVDCIYGKFISWMDLKEVRDNLDSEHIQNCAREDNTFPSKDLIWFEGNKNRLLFLEECLNKF